MLWSSLRAPRDAGRSSSHHCLCRLRPHILRTAVRIETDPTVRMAHALKPVIIAVARYFSPCSWGARIVGSIACAKVFLGLPGEIACHNYALRFVFGNDWLRRFWSSCGYHQVIETDLLMQSVRCACPHLCHARCGPCRGIRHMSPQSPAEPLLPRRRSCVPTS